MQRAHNRHALNYHALWSAGNLRRVELLLFLTAAVLLAPFALPAVSRAVASIPSLLENGRSTQPSLVPSSTGSSKTSASRDDAAFDQTARQLAAAGSSESLGRLVQMLNQNENASHRVTVLQLLKDAPPDVNPILIAALSDSDEAVRAGAAQVLGLRRDTRTVGALDAATRDPRTWVRSEAAQSLGEIQAWQELPRLNRLQVSDPNPTVYTAARNAATAIRKGIATELGLQESQLVDVSVTGFYPQVYAVTRDNLYVRKGSVWEIAGPVPDNPLALVAGSDGVSLYLTTAHFGLYQSMDHGMTWQRLQFGANTPRPVIVTALATSPQVSGRLYAALAALGSKPDELIPLDLVTSSDGGNSWISLPDAPLLAVTTHLYTDPESPGYLFGLADNTPWRYLLPSELCTGCPARVPSPAASP